MNWIKLSTLSVLNLQTSRENRQKRRYLFHVKYIRENKGYYGCTIKYQRVAEANIADAFPLGVSSRTPFLSPAANARLEVWSQGCRGQMSAEGHSWEVYWMGPGSCECCIQRAQASACALRPRCVHWHARRRGGPAATCPDQPHAGMAARPWGGWPVRSRSVCSRQEENASCTTVTWLSIPFLINEVNPQG